MSDSNLGKDGTIPNSDDGLAVGHVPDGSHFNPEEEGPVTTAATTETETETADTRPGSVPGSPTTASTDETGSYTDAEGDDREDRPAEKDGAYTDADE